MHLSPLGDSFSEGIRLEFALDAISMTFNIGGSAGPQPQAADKKLCSPDE